MSRDHAQKTYGPPGNEDPVEATTDIRWSNPTGTVSIPRVYVYSTGVYFPVAYRTVDTPPPLPENTPDERRAAAEASFDRMRGGRQRVERLKVNGAHVEVPSVKSHERGFTAWAWSDSRTHQADRPENALRFQFDWPDFPGADSTVPYPPPGSPTGPVRGAPTFWHDERGAGHIVLQKPPIDPAIPGEPPEEPA
jgi:hypothetical protein